MAFEPDYHYMLDVLANRRPERLPVYEHLINPPFMEKVLGTRFAHLGASTDPGELNTFFANYCRFYREMTYDTVSYEVCITEILPENGAIMGGKPGPIQNPADFERYPWNDLPDIFWAAAKPRFDALRQAMPEGMLALGGVGNGVFDISEDLVGFEYLAFMQADYPALHTRLYQAIGDLMVELWQRFLTEYSDLYCVCRFGDDLGFKTSTLVSPRTLRKHVIPQYRRVIELVHDAGKPFLWHSCGNIFGVMEDAIAVGIDAKHSNEDTIAPYDRWIELYGDRIGLLGGIDVDVLCKYKPDEVFERVIESGRRFRASAKGYALGSGNSIPEYVPVESYLAMIRAAQALREEE